MHNVNIFWECEVILMWGVKMAVFPPNFSSYFFFSLYLLSDSLYLSFSFSLLSSSFSFPSISSYTCVCTPCCSYPHPLSRPPPYSSAPPRYFRTFHPRPISLPTFALNSQQVTFVQDCVKLFVEGVNKSINSLTRD